MTIVARLEEQTLVPADELSKLMRGAAGDGAVVAFVGIARAQANDGAPVERLVLEHHPRLTLQSIEKITHEAAQRFPVSHVHVVHRCGEMAPGEPIVFAGVVSTHRRAAFEAADYLMDRLKTEPLMWKREDGPEGPHWIEPTQADYAERDRWE